MFNLKSPLARHFHRPFDVRPAGPVALGLTMSDGAELPASLWAPRRPSLIMLGLHGFGDDRHAFDLVGPWLARRSAALFAFDQRGFGRAQAPVWAGIDTYLDDVASALVAIRTEAARRFGPGDLPVALIGESMGASLALAFAAGQIGLVDAVIAAGPGIVADMPNEAFWVGVGALVSALAPGLRVPVDRVGDPTLHPLARRRFEAGEGTMRSLSAATHRELVRLCYRASSAAERIGVSTLLLHGAEDPLIHPRSMRRLAVALGRSGELRVLPGVSHLVLQTVEQARLEHALGGFLARMMAPHAVRGARSAP